MKFYTFIKASDIDSVMKHGLASSIAISKNKDILSHLFKTKKDISDYISNINDSDITQRGPSVFFQAPPSISDILKKDPNHILGQDDYILLEIDYELLSKETNSYVFGLELEPYTSDKEYNLNKNKIEKKLSDKDLKALSEKSADEAWNYFEPIDGFYAPNVPHGVIITDTGYIDPKYIKKVKSIENKAKDRLVPPFFAKNFDYNDRLNKIITKLNFENNNIDKRLKYTDLSKENLKDIKFKLKQNKDLSLKKIK